MIHDIFISYASLGLGVNAPDFKRAQMLFEKLTAAGFSVWFDHNALTPGYRWHEEIEAHCEASRIILPVLTPRWQQSEWTKYETYVHDEVIPLWFEGTFDEAFTPPLRRFQALAIDFMVTPDAAFGKLVDAIRQRLAIAAPEPARRLVRMRLGRARNFVGREKQLNEIHEKLWVNPTPHLTQARVQVVTAMGGVGKTTLAREYAERFWRLYPQAFWIDCPIGLQTEFAVLFDILFPAQRDFGLDAPTKAARALEELNQTEHRPQRLLILDDALDEQAVLPWIPRHGRCHTLITSCFTGWSHQAERCAVWILDPEPARELLLKRSGRNWNQLSPDERAAVDHLAQRLDYLPLALEQAAAYIGAPVTQCTFRKYIELFNAAEKHFLELQASTGETEYKASVYATWRTTIDRLPAESRTILRLAAFMAPTPIPQKLWLAAAVIVKAESAAFSASRTSPPAPGEPPLPAEVEVPRWIAPLALYSMVQAHGGLEEGDFSVHALVQAVERHAIAPDVRAHWAQQAAEALVAFVPAEGGRFGAWPIWRICNPHGVAIHRHLSVLHLSGNASLLNGMATYQHGQANYADAEPLFREALAMCRTALPAGHPDIASSLNNLASLLQAQGKLADAEPLFREALAIYRTALPAGHPDIATSLNNLASLLQAQGKLADAEPLFREALAMCRTALPAGHPDIATSLNNLASLLQAQGKLADAEPLFREALAMCRTALPAGHPDIASSLNNLASLLKAQGKLADAEPLYREALAIYRTALPAGHPDIATSLNNLASLLQAQGKLADAEPLYREALSMRRTALPAGHPHIAQSLNNLAVLLQAQGKLADAEPLFREALSMRRTALPAGHPHIALSLNNLASLLQAQGKLADAEPLFREALSMRRTALPAGHPDIATSLNNLASLLQAQGKLADAEPLYREALSMRRTALPAGHPHIAQSLNNLASLLKDQGKLADAEPLFREALSMRRTALPAGHPHIAQSLNNLAVLLEAQGKLADAEPLYREALAIYRTALPAGHPDIATSLNNLASLLQAQGKLADAEPLYREVLEEHDRLGRPETPGFAIDLNNYALLLRKLARFNEAAIRLQRAIRIEDASLPPEHPKRPHRRNNLSVVLMLAGQYEEATKWNAEAWTLKAGRHDLTSGRILFARVGLCWLIGDEAGMYLGQLQTLLERGELPIDGGIDRKWDAADVVAHLRQVLPEPRGNLLALLVEVLNDLPRRGELDSFAEWRQALPVPLSRPWPA